jgi:fructose-1-phosphate kinase PfkB-like protein
MSRNISKARRRVPATRLSADDLYVIIEAIDSYCARRAGDFSEDLLIGSEDVPDALAVLRDVIYNLAEKKDAQGRDLKSYALQLDRTGLEYIVVALAEAQRSWVSNYDVDEALVTLSRINSSPVYAGAVS